MTAIVVAYTKNRVIGKDNDLPWHMPADMKHFKDITTGGTVIMGRKTYDSVIKQLKGPLPNRRNIVVSRSLKSVPKGWELAGSIDEALEMADADNSDAEAFVVGGEQIFKSVLDDDLIDQLYLTEIDTEIDGDAFFPDLNEADWLEISNVKHSKDDKNPYDYSFIVKIRLPHE